MVHGVPALAAPVPLPVEVGVRMGAGAGVRILCEPPEGGARREGSEDARREAARRVMEALGLDTGALAVEIRCRDDLPGWSGLGSSAGFCVALARAAARAAGLDDSDEAINRAAYEGERVFAGNPSGIDNTVATYGRTVWFRRGDGRGPCFLRLGTPLAMVIGNSGFPSHTAAMVDRVARFRDASSGRFRQLCREAEALAVRFRVALEAGELPDLGDLMNQGHGLLQDLGVSHATLDGMVTICREAGALGAKLTGAGGGGCMIALASDPESAERMAGALRRSGHTALSTRIT